MRQHWAGSLCDGTFERPTQAQFVAVLSNWIVTGYVTVKEVMLDWIADNLSGYDVRIIAKLMHDHLQAGRWPAQVHERRPEYSDHDYHYDFRVVPSVAL